MSYLQADGHPAFLFGEKRWHGWWYYFPAAFVLKTSPSLLILAALGAALLWIRRSLFAVDNAYWLPGVGIVGVLLPSMVSSMNLGVRFILPVYPLLAILGSRGVRLSGVNLRSETGV